MGARRLALIARSGKRELHVVLRTGEQLQRCNPDLWLIPGYSSSHTVVRLWRVALHASSAGRRAQGLPAAALLLMPATQAAVSSSPTDLLARGVSSAHRDQESYRPVPHNNYSLTRWQGG